MPTLPPCLSGQVAREVGHAPAGDWLSSRRGGKEERVLAGEWGNLAGEAGEVNEVCTQL